MEFALTQRHFMSKRHCRRYNKIDYKPTPEEIYLADQEDMEEWRLIRVRKVVLKLSTYV